MSICSFAVFIAACLLPAIESVEFYGSGYRVAPKVEFLSDYKTGYVLQVLDHFSSNQTPSWSQRYFSSDNLWRGGKSPVFLMVGGEGEESPNWLGGGAWYNWAYEHGAYMFVLEHRFYGESKPTKDASTANLKYLSSRQALEDLAHFITEMNKMHNFTTDNKWILFGGSYPANLAAWARLKYPDLVFGSVASSGPLEAKADFFEYDDVVRDSLNYYSPGCADVVTRAMKSIQKLLTSNSGLATFNSKIPICGGFNRTNPLDQQIVFQSLSGIFTKAVQYNNQEDLGIVQICKYLNPSDTNTPALDKLANLYNSTQKGCVYSTYKGYVTYFKQYQWTDTPVAKSARQWIFQTCNEFGYYQTSPKSTSLFSNTIPLSLSTQICTDVFGPSYNPTQLNNAIAATNKFYEGRDIDVERVVFTQGSIDPWHPLGMINNPTDQAPLIYIEGTSHTYDMLTPSFYDPPSLVAARNTTGQYIAYWISL